METPVKFNGELWDWLSMPLSIVGAWPLKNTYLRFHLWIFYCIVELIIALADLIDVFGDLEAVIMNFVTTGLHTMIILRLIVFYYSKHLAPVIIATKKDMNSDNYETDEEMKIYSRYYASAVFFFKLVMSSACFSTSMYYILPLERYFTATVSANESRILMIPVRAKVPFDITNVRNAALVYAFQLPIVFILIAYATSVCLFIALALNVCGQLAILSHRIMNLNIDSHADKRQFFSNFVQRHLRVIWMVDSIEHVFQMILFYELTVTSIIVGLVGYYTLTSIDNNASTFTATIFVCTAATMISPIFGNSLVGEYLRFECEKLRDAYYQCNWYNMPSSYKQCMIICTIQAQVSLQLTAGKFYVFSLESFTEFMKRCMAYVSMLRTMTTKP